VEDWVPGWREFTLKLTYGSGGGPKIGVSLNEVKGGLEITQLTKGGGAAKAGLEVGDVITRVDRKKVKKMSDVHKVLKKKKKGQKVKVEVKRGGKRKTFEVELQ
jgi:C-terminal processing protease CtpA/Prc